MKSLMKRKIVGAFLASGVLFAANVASAAPILVGQSATYSYSGFGSTLDDTCSACTAVATFTLVDLNTFQIDLKNTSTTVGGSNILTQLLVSTNPALVYVADSAVFSGVPSGSWEIANNVGSAWSFKTDTTKGANNALIAGGGSLSVTFDFTLNPNATAEGGVNILDSQAHWQQTRDGSDKGDGHLQVPEPSSILLLALGLAFGAGAVRRRKLTS